MRKKGYKGRCEKKDLSKSQEVCRTYDAIQSNYADIDRKSTRLNSSHWKQSRMPSSA